VCDEEYTAMIDRIYFAAPMQMYNDPLYDVALRHVHELFPFAEVLSARDLFTSSADWREKWPAIQPTVDMLVFITDRDGWIGRGVLKEILDIGKGLWRPTDLLTPDGEFHRLGNFLVNASRPRDWRRHVQIVVRSPAKPGGR